MSLAPYDLNQQRKALACDFYRAKVKKAVVDTIRGCAVRGGMKGKRRQIAGRFRTNVLLRTGFSAFQACYMAHTGCYRLGWVLAKRVKEELAAALQALAAWQRPALSPSQDLPESSLSAILNYRKTEETPSSGSGILSESPLPKPRKGPGVLAAKGQRLVLKLRRLLLHPSFQSLKSWTRGSFSDFNFPIKEDLRRTQKVKTEETKSLVDSRAAEALAKSARLSQKVSSILKLIDGRKTPSGTDRDTSRSFQSRDSTPKRNLNLRIPTTGSATSSPPLSPISMGDLESDTSRVKPGKLPKSTASPRTFNLDLSQLDLFERRIQVWKAWKDLVMQRKLYNLKKSIAQRSAKMKSLRKTWKWLQNWREKGRKRENNLLVAESFYAGNVKKRTFRKLTASLLLSMQNSHINRLHPTHISLQILAFWHQIAHSRTISRQKSALLTRYSSLKLRHKYLKVWHLAVQVRAKEHQQKENALFFWYSNAMPKYWQQLVGGVAVSRARKIRRMQADRSYAIGLIRKAVTGWGEVCTVLERLKEAAMQAKAVICGKKASEVLDLLKSRANRRRKMRIRLAAVAELAASNAKSKAINRLRAFAGRNLRRREKSDQALWLYAQSLTGKGLLGWRIAAERMRTCREAEAIIKESHYLACANAVLAQWRSAVKERRNGLFRLGRKQEKHLLASIFAQFRTVCGQLTAKRKREISQIMTHQDFLTQRIFALWRQTATCRKQHQNANKAAQNHYLALQFQAWLKVYQRTSALRKLTTRKTLKQNWALWKLRHDSIHMEKCSELLASRHYRERKLGSLMTLWRAKTVLNPLSLSKAGQFKAEKEGWRLKEVWRVWKIARLLLKREMYAQKLAKSAVGLRNQKMKALIVTFLYNYTRKGVILRKKSRKMSAKVAFSHFEAATELARSRLSRNRRFRRLTQTHLTESRLLRGLHSLSRKAAHSQLLTSLSQQVLKGRILASIQHWRSYGSRYLRLLRKADAFKGKRDLCRKQGALQWMLKCAAQTSWRRRLQKRLFFYWDQRVKRLFQAWKRGFEYRKELDEVVLKLQVTVLLKAYFSTLRRYSAAQRRLKAYKVAQIDRRRTFLLQSSFGALQNYAFKAVSVRKGHFQGLKLHANRLNLWVFAGWREYVKVKTTQNFRQKRLKLQRNLRFWEQKKAFQCAMDYVKPRLRKAAGMKLGALFKWKLAASRPAATCPAPAAHVFMKYLVPKIDEFPIISAELASKSPIMGLIWPQWRAAVLFNRLFLDVRGTLYRKRLLGKASLLRFRKGTMMARVRRKKTWNAVLFSRLKGKLRVFQLWKQTTVLGKRPKSAVRARTPGGRLKGAVKT